MDEQIHRIWRCFSHLVGLYAKSVIVYHVIETCKFLRYDPLSILMKFILIFHLRSSVNYSVNGVKNQPLLLFVVILTKKHPFQLSLSKHYLLCPYGTLLSHLLHIHSKSNTPVIIVWNLNCSNYTSVDYLCRLKSLHRATSSAAVQRCDLRCDPLSSGRAQNWSASQNLFGRMNPFVVENRRVLWQGDNFPVNVLSRLLDSLLYLPALSLCVFRFPDFGPVIQRKK